MFENVAADDTVELAEAVGRTSQATSVRAACPLRS